MKCEVVCRRPCRLRLSCDHICIGACGEKCLCAYCHLKHLPPTFWKRFHPNAIFIQLPDCQCVLELRSLDKYMDRPVRNDSDVKKCPRCSKPVKSHIRRYTNIQKELQTIIHNKYTTLTRSPQSVERLKREASSLTRRFLSTSEVTSLNNRTDKCSRNGTLSTIGLVMQNLKKLSEVDPDIDMEVLRVNGLLDPKKLKDLLIYIREFPTEQFWREIENEIDRLPKLKPKTTGVAVERLAERIRAMKTERQKLRKLNLYEDNASVESLQEAQENAAALLAALWNERSEKKEIKRDKAAKRATKANSAGQYYSLSSHAKRTGELELALGSDSIGSAESASTTLTSQPSASHNYLLGSDSLDT